MIKDEIREDMRAKRRALSKDEVKIKSDEIRQRLLGVERVKQAKTICTFISAFKEPDTVEIIKELWEQDKKIIVNKKTDHCDTSLPVVISISVRRFLYSFL